MSSNFGDFLTQLPANLVGIFCLFGSLLIIAIALIFRERLGLGARKPAAQAQELWGGLTAALRPQAESELPDLDLLVDTSTLAASKPASPGRSGSVYQVKLSDGRQVDAVEVMTLLRDLGDGRLIVHIGEKAYRSGERVSDPEFIRRLTSAMPELETLVANIEAAVQPPAAPVAPIAAPAPVVAAPAVPPAAPVIEHEEEMPSESPAETEDAPPLDSPSMEALVSPDSSPEEAASEPPPPEAASDPESPPDSATPASDKPVSSKRAAKKRPALPGDLPKYESNEPLKQRKNLFERIPKPEPIPDLDIAGAIETFLQFKLDQTPEYAERSIHVHPSPTGGVMIEVDGVYYETVGDVADQQVREFLSTTIQEWQDRQ